MQVIMKSDIGRMRKVNQDYVRCYQQSDHECLVVLCDGMGGHNAGEIASQMACDDIIENYQQQESLTDTSQIHDWILSAIQHAHMIVESKSHESQEFEGMGTTIVLVLCIHDNIYISHVGDSRVYWVTDEFIQLTRDDTLVNVLVDSGTISQAEARFHPQKNILLQAVGVSDSLNPSFLEKQINDGFLLVCSDGLYNSLSDEQMMSILHAQEDIETRASQLMDAANTYGGQDNISFALILTKGVVNL
mgnify:FL=1